MSLTNSDDNENSIHFIDSNHDEFQYIEEEIPPSADHHDVDDNGNDNNNDEVNDADDDDDDGDDEENAESYYTIEIEDDFDTDFERDSLIA